MGVVKNLMVRVGANVRGVVQGMKSAGSATADAKQRIQKNTTSIKKTIADNFGGADKTVRGFVASVKQTKQAHTVAEQDVTRLSDKLEDLKGVYTTVKTATAGLDLGKSLSQQMTEAEEALVKIEHRRKKIEKELASITSPRASSGKRTAALQTELSLLTQKSAFAIERLKQIDKIAEAVGESNLGHASAAGLEKLQQQIQNTENELKTAQKIVDETGQRIKNMGSAGGYAVGRLIGKLGSGLKTAAYAAGNGIVKLGAAALKATGHGLKNLGIAVTKVGSIAGRVAVGGVKKLWNALARLASGTLRGITSLTGKLLRIGKDAYSGAGGVKKLAQQVRNVGVVSAGLRVAGGMFGRLRSIISNYISSNEELSAATSMITYQLGNTLEPAIRLVMAAMQQLMPVVQKVSNAINAVLRSIIGEIGEVQYAFRQLGTYGFDQITKSDEETEESTTEQEQSALVTKLTGWIRQLKDAFTSGDWEGLGKLVGRGIQNAFDEINKVDVSGKVTAFVNNLSTTVSAAFSAIDFAGLGQNAAARLEATVTNVNWNSIGKTIGQVFTALPSMVVGYINGADWASAGEAISTTLKAVLVAGTDWVRNTDWIRVGESVQTFLAATDWGGIAQSFFGLLSAAFEAIDFTSIGNTAATMVNDVIRDADWVQLGATVGRYLLALPQMVFGFVREMDWQSLSQGVSQGLKAALKTAIAWVKETDWLGLGKSISGFIQKTDWGKIAGDFLKRLTDAFKSLNFTSLGNLLGRGFSSALSWLHRALKGFNWKQVGGMLASELNDLVHAVNWLELGQSVSNLVSAALQSISGAVSAFDWLGLGAGIADCINGLDWVGMLSNLAKSVSDILGGALDLLIGFAQKLDWGQLNTDLWNGLIGVVTGIDWSGLISKAFSLLGSALGGAASLITTFHANVAASLAQGFAAAGQYFQTYIDDAGGDVGKGILNAIGATFVGIGTWIKDNLWTPFKDGFETAFGDTGERLKGIFTGIIDTIEPTINSIISMVNGLLSAMASGVNGLIDAINAVKIELPDWAILGDLAGLTFGFNLKKITAYQIPMLGKGGIVDGATPLIAGEKGKEAIVPLENNTEWIDKVADKITTRQTGGSGQPVIIQVLLGKRKLTEYVIQDINQITKSTGVCPIKV